MTAIVPFYKSGIYFLFCKANGRFYIGQSIDLKTRITAHFTALKGNYHRNKSLQNSFNKYGFHSFDSGIKIRCSICELDLMERFFISFHNSISNGFNFDSGGNLNKTISIESKKKMSESKIGKPSGKKGTKASDELKRKLSLAHIGKPSPMKGIKRKMPAWNIGLKRNGPSLILKPVYNVYDKKTKESFGSFASIMEMKSSLNISTRNRKKYSDTEFCFGKYVYSYSKTSNLAV